MNFLKEFYHCGISSGSPHLGQWLFSPHLGSGNSP